MTGPERGAGVRCVVSTWLLRDFSFQTALKFSTNQEFHDSYCYFVTQPSGQSGKDIYVFFVFSCFYFPKDKGPW